MCDPASLLPLVPLPSLQQESSSKNNKGDADPQVPVQTKQATQGKRHRKPKRKAVKKVVLKAKKKKKTKRASAVSTKPKPKRTRKTKTDAQPRAGKNKKQRVAGEDDNTTLTGTDILSETGLVESFKWPQMLMKHVISKGVIDSDDTKIRVKMFSEFSGAGTAEVAMKALAAAAPDRLSCEVVHQADWNSSCQHLIRKPAWLA